MVSFTSEDGTSVDKLYPLEDTPSEQIINFPEGTTSAKIELKIISVYPGSEWSDTCITQIRGK